jgi:hypothetical protein
MFLKIYQDKVKKENKGVFHFFSFTKVVKDRGKRNGCSPIFLKLN